MVIIVVAVPAIGAAIFFYERLPEIKALFHKIFGKKNAMVYVAPEGIEREDCVGINSSDTPEQTSELIDVASKPPTGVDLVSNFFFIPRVFLRVLVTTVHGLLGDGKAEACGFSR